MKITPNDLTQLAAFIRPLDTPERRVQYLAGNFPRADLVKDLNMRYRWDVLYASQIKIGDGVGIQGDLNLYSYLNDTHIDTALRSIVAELQ